MKYTKLYPRGKLNVGVNYLDLNHLQTANELPLFVGSKFSRIKFIDKIINIF